MADPAAQIWRDYVTDGVPASGKHKPVKAKVREWGTEVEAAAAAINAVLDANDNFPGYIDLNEIVSPAAPTANKARIFAKDVAGATKIYFRDSTGSQFEIGGTVPVVGMPVHDVTTFGAVGDYAVVFDAAMGSGSATLTSASNPFTAGDVGKYIAVQGAGAAGVNLFTTIAAFVSAGQVTLADANASGGSISSKIAEFGTDNTQAFQDAIDAANPGGGSVYIPFGAYLISRLNFAEKYNFEMFGDGVNATRLFPMHVSAYSTTAGHVIDLTGSAFVKLRRFQLGAFYSLPQPQTGLFLAQIASGVSNRIVLDEVYVTGQYAIAPFYNYGVPSSVARVSDFYNYKPGAGAHNCMKLTGDNLNSLTSSFATVASGDFSTSDWAFYGCEWHKFAGAGANDSVIQLDQVSNILFSSGVISGGASHYVGFDEACSGITFDNVTMETEGEPVIPTNVFNVASGSVVTNVEWSPTSLYIISGALKGGSGTIDFLNGETLIIPVGDETTDITTGTAKVTFRMPFAMFAADVRASLNAASSSGVPTVDINEAGTTILSTKLTIDANEKTSKTAATPPVISDPTLADDAEMTIDIDIAGTGAKGLKVALYGVRL